jgi:septum formation protein
MKKGTRLVLASTSRRRFELLHGMGLEFKVVDPAIDESEIVEDTPRETAAARAREKALAVSKREIGAKVIASDTIVVLDGKILDKAIDDDDVGRMLAILKGREHTVITSIAVVFPMDGRFEVLTDEARVTFRDLQSSDMDWYIGTGEGVGKAGGYAIQGLGGTLVATLDGDRETVIGLPTRIVEKILEADVDRSPKPLLPEDE